MARNKTLSFVRRDPSVHVEAHQDECAICGRRKLEREAVMAVFHPKDPPSMAAAYCVPCIDGLRRARRLGASLPRSPAD